MRRFQSFPLHALPPVLRTIETFANPVAAIPGVRSWRTHSITKASVNSPRAFVCRGSVLWLLRRHDTGKHRDAAGDLIDKNRVRAFQWSFADIGNAAPHYSAYWLDSENAFRNAIFAAGFTGRNCRGYPPGGENPRCCIAERVRQCGLIYPALNLINA